MATIKIERTRAYIHRIGDYHIYIDGQKAGTISNGKSKEFETTAGSHSVIAKIEKFSSPELAINLTDNESITLNVNGTKKGIWLMPLTLGIIVLNNILSGTIDFNYTLILLLPTLLLMFYYMTIGRKYYLNLDEIKRKKQQQLLTTGF